MHTEYHIHIEYFSKITGGGHRVINYDDKQTRNSVFDEIAEKLSDKKITSDQLRINGGAIVTTSELHQPSKAIASFERELYVGTGALEALFEIVGETL